MKYYTIWVSGGEVNDYHISTRKRAEEIQEEWKEEGYKAIIEKVTI
jgi:hypothetical protein